MNQFDGLCVSSDRDIRRQLRVDMFGHDGFPFTPIHVGHTHRVNDDVRLQSTKLRGNRIDRLKVELTRSHLSQSNRVPMCAEYYIETVTRTACPVHTKQPGSAGNKQPFQCVADFRAPTISFLCFR